MRKAAWVASEGVQAGLDALAPGVTEYEVYGAFMGRMYALGSEGDGFYPFLTSGAGDRGRALPDEPGARRGRRDRHGHGPDHRGLQRRLHAHRLRRRADAASSRSSTASTTRRCTPASRRSSPASTSPRSTRPCAHGARPRLHGEPVRHRPRHRPQLLRAARLHEGRDGARPISTSCSSPACASRSSRASTRCSTTNTYIQAALEETVMVTDDGVEVLTTTPFLEECLAATV